MKRSAGLLACVCVGMAVAALAASAAEPASQVQDLLARSGVRRGVCLILAASADALPLQLAEASELSIYVQMPAADEVAKLRAAAEQAGWLGRRIFVAQGAPSQLHLADNLADLVIARAAAIDPGASSRAEILRVLRPGAKCLIGSQEFVKADPQGTDDWSHPYHGPDNNPQSQDQLARAPYLTHFLAEPWYSPMPLVTVAAGGRLFKAFGHIAIKQREWPLLNMLVAQSAYNGTILWQRPLSPNFMIHRSAMIATPHTLFLADDQSCKLLDAASGEVRGEIVLSAEDGPVWKWIALADGMLYALAGSEETPDPTVRGDRRARGWPWGPPLGRGYNSKTYPWGFGQTILAIDPQSREVLWRHREAEPLDARAMCLAAGRLYFYSHGQLLGALQATTGELLWRSTDAELLQAIGAHRFAQNPREGFSSSSYVKANAQGLYFAGPIRTDLVAVSADEGRLLWRQAEGGNSQLVLREEGLYAMGPGGSARLDYGTGDLLAGLGPRVNCTRATGSVDSIFVRGGRDGTMRYDLLNEGQQHLCPIRPSCQDGVIVAHGHLYWGPWMCDCNLTLVGVVSLAPAGDFDFAGDPGEASRLETATDPLPAAALEIGPADWPTLRANNTRSAASSASVPPAVQLRWTSKSAAGLPATGPVTAGGLIVAGGRDGVVRAWDAARGDVRWTASTGGPIFYPPTLWQNRVLAGSADGWIYCLEAASGRQLWRFRAAPAERVIPVYGSLHSTWPVASGVLVEDGVAYAAAGMANHDGTHVFALDAASGRLLWHNSTSGSLDPQTGAGASVNGHLLLDDQRLYMAGGNVVPVVSYDLADGTCRTDPSVPASHTQFTAGSDLYLLGQRVLSGGPPLHSARGDYRMVNQAALQTPVGDLALAYGPHDARVAWFAPGALQRPGSAPRWQAQPLNRILAVAVGANAIVIGGLRDAAEATELPAAQLVALRAEDGSILWSQPLPAEPVPWGVAIDRDGRIAVALQDGRLACYAPAP